MPHYYPVVLQSGKSLAGDSLGFHAYSLRIDNLTNQWLLEETSLAWIPPYSLGVCLRLYGTGVAIILNQAPAGQPQLTAITGEQSVGVYSDQLRTEVAGTPVRQFSAVQSVSDLTTGAMPATPPSGIDRLWADNQGNIHHLHADGTDRTLVDASNVVTALYPTTDPHYQAMINSSIGAATVGGDSSGTIANIQNNQARSNFSVLGGWLFLPDASHYLTTAGDYLYVRYNNGVIVQNGAGNAYTPISAGSLTSTGNINASGYIAAGGQASASPGDVTANRGNNTGYFFAGNTQAWIGFDGTRFVLGPAFGIATTANGGGPAAIPGGGCAAFLMISAPNGGQYKIPMYYN